MMDQGRAGLRRAAYATALSVAAAAAVFTLVVSTLLIATHVQLLVNDPLNDPVLVSLRESYGRDPQNDDYRQAIRRMDWLARRAFFTGRRQIRTGMWLAMAGAATMLAALGIAQAVGRRAPRVPREGMPGLPWETIARARWWVAGTGATLAVAALVFGTSTPTQLTPDVAARELRGGGASGAAGGGPLPPGAGAPSPVAGVPPAAAPPPPAAGDMSRNFPGFRGADGSGWIRAGGAPADWNEQQGRNVLWKAPVPLPGMSSPVVWNDRIYVSGATRKERALFCYAARDGALLWTGTYKSDPNAPEDYPVFDTPEIVMHAVPTPATDGRFVCALFANGEIAAFDAAAGKPLWSRLLGSTRGNVYGLSNSLLAYEGSVIVMFNGDRQLLMRLDGLTGKQLWSAVRDDISWASPVLASTASGRKLVITHGDPETAAWDPETGAKQWATDLVKNDVAPSPLCVNGRVYTVLAGYGIFAVNAEDGQRVWSVESLDKASFCDVQSLATDGTRIYQFCDRVLSVLSAADGRVLSEQELDLQANYASPFVAEDRLYLIGGKEALVLKAGDTPEILAVCSLDEPVETNPAVARGVIYARTEKSLYAIGARNGKP